MLFDLQSEAVTKKIFKKFDTIIVGAGAAGITTAITLEKSGKSLALIDGGGAGVLRRIPKYL
jgi:thioredoxin reductase